MYTINKSAGMSGNVGVDLFVWLFGFYGISTFVFNAKSIFIQIISSISNTSFLHAYTI